MKKKIVILSVVFLFMQGLIHAQSVTGAQQLVEIIARLKEVYRSKEYLSYNVRFRYSNESTPAEVLDSLQGRVVLMDSTRYWGTLDNTETMVNPQYSVLVFKDDRLLYLAKPQPHSLFQPLEDLENFLLQNRGITYQQRTTEARKVVRMYFDSSAVCKELVLTIDTTSGYLVKMVSIVPTEQLVDAAERSAFSPQADGYEPYARVEVLFEGYSSAPVDRSLFDEHRYFFREGTQFLPADAFKEYKIFLATPDL